MTSLVADRKKRGNLRGVLVEPDQNLTLDDAFNAFSLAKEIAGMRERTLKDHTYIFTYFMEWLTISHPYINKHNQITTQICRDYIYYLLKRKVKWDDHAHIQSSQVGLSPVTVNVRLRALKAQYNWYLGEGYVNENPWAMIPNLKTDENLTPSLTKGQMWQLINAPDKKTFLGYRDYAVIQTLLDSGCRISELLSVDEDDVDSDHHTITLYAENTKGRASRSISLTDNTVRILRRLMQLNDLLKERSSALFLSVTGNRLAASDVRRQIKKYATQLGIRNTRISPHICRHTMAKQYILNGGNVFTLQRQLGHRDISMTRRYVKMNDSDVALMHAKFSPVSAQRRINK